MYLLGHLVASSLSKVGFQADSCLLDTTTHIFVYLMARVVLVKTAQNTRGIILNFKQAIGLGLTDYGQHHLGQVHDQGDLGILL